MYTLVNVEERAAGAPTTFEVAPRIVRESLGRKFFAKLVFNYDGDESPGERMWVEITACLPDGTYRGELNNTPIVSNDLHLGAPITFGPEHVSDIDTPLGWPEQDDKMDQMSDGGQ